MWPEQSESGRNEVSEVATGAGGTGQLWGLQEDIAVGFSSFFFPFRLHWRHMEVPRLEV